VFVAFTGPYVWQLYRESTAPTQGSGPVRGDGDGPGPPLDPPPPPPPVWLPPEPPPPLEPGDGSALDDALADAVADGVVVGVGVDDAVGGGGGGGLDAVWAFTNANVSKTAARMMPGRMAGTKERKRLRPERILIVV
jgi:hypothetical protein